MYNNPRRVLHWDRVNNPKSVFAVTVATALGAGLFPLAPGTFGTVVGVVLSYSTNDYSTFLKILIWVSVFLIGTWSAKVIDETMKTGDNQNIVIDEVLGLGISAWTAGTQTKTLIAAFLLFRLFDMVKPFPIRSLDNWSKTKATGGNHEASYWWSGFGVMADDVLAGVYALLIILVLQHLSYLP